MKCLSPTRFQEPIEREEKPAEGAEGEGSAGDPREGKGSHRAAQGRVFGWGAAWLCLPRLHHLAGASRTTDVIPPAGRKSEGIAAAFRAPARMTEPTPAVGRGTETAFSWHRPGDEFPQQWTQKKLLKYISKVSLHLLSFCFSFTLVGCSPPLTAISYLNVQ